MIRWIRLVTNDGIIEDRINWINWMAKVDTFRKRLGVSLNLLVDRISTRLDPTFSWILPFRRKKNVFPEKKMKKTFRRRESERFFRIEDYGEKWNIGHLA